MVTLSLTDLIDTDRCVPPSAKARSVREGAQRSASSAAAAHMETFWKLLLTAAGVACAIFLQILSCFAFDNNWCAHHTP